jgi:hypothetical protein
MNNINGLIRLFDTLLFSWGSDTPSEAIWSANELIEWIESEFSVNIPSRFDETNPDVYQTVVDDIKLSLNSIEK